MYFIDFMLHLAHLTSHLNCFLYWSRSRVETEYSTPRNDYLSPLEIWKLLPTTSPAWDAFPLEEFAQPYLDLLYGFCTALESKIWHLIQKNLDSITIMNKPISLHIFQLLALLRDFGHLSVQTSVPAPLLPMRNSVECMPEFRLWISDRSGQNII